MRVFLFLLLFFYGMVFSVFAQLVNDTAVRPVYIGYDNHRDYGIVGHKLYAREATSTAKGNWQYHSTIPFTIKSLDSRIDDNLLTYIFDDSVYYYHIDSKEFKRRSIIKEIADFCATDIRQILFTRGSSGCFSYHAAEAVYKKNSNGDFALDTFISGREESDPVLPAARQQVDKNIIYTFLKDLPKLLNERPSMEELQFSEDDFAQCKRDVLAFTESLSKKEKDEETAFWLNESDVDILRLHAVTDKLKQMNTDTLAACLFEARQGHMSTSSNWIKIIFTNNKGENMMIHHHYYHDDHNSVHLPWAVRINLTFKLAVSLKISEFINTAYPGFLGQKNKVPLLHAILREYYQL
jgi:hypothetical protein